MSMRHFSCDLCGKDLTADADARYVVRMEVFPAATVAPGELTAADLDADHVEAMAELLDEIEAGGDPAPAAPAGGPALEYDLCPACHRKFVADPLGRGASRKARFSQN